MSGPPPQRRAVAWWAAAVVCAALLIVGAGPVSGVSPVETGQALSRAAPSPRDLRALTGRFRDLAAIPLVVSPDAPVRRVGQVERFWIARQNPPEHFQVDAELRFIGRHAYWYVQQGHTVAERDLRRSAELFDTHLYPGVRRFVGSEAFPGIDNDPRITIFNGTTPGVAGYVSSVDAYPKTVHPASNEREIVYLNVRAMQVGSADYHATLAHELTHLVHQNVNLADETWIKEGVADLMAAVLVPERPLRTGAYFAEPDVQLTAWSDGGAGAPVAAHYQAAAWFLRYYLDRFGEAALADLLARFPTGPGSLEALPAGRDAPTGFAELFRTWTIANLGADRQGGVVPPYGTPPAASPSVRPLERNRPVEDVVAQFGVDYYEAVPRGPVAVEFQGAATTPVLGAPPASGAGMWYGGRADATVADLTRRFDLRAARAATLQYDLWYDLEREYDYLYLAASVDGGQTWTLVAAPQMTRENPTGNNLGVGYTGISGGGAAPVWVREVVDLAPFVGRQVDLRFSYVTDDAFTRPGVALDNVQIDAVEFVDGAETDREGWELAGWARIGPDVAQPWLVTLVVWWTDRAPELVRVPVDVTGRGQWSSGGAPVERLALAVSGAAPVTLQRASYRLELRAP